MSARHTDERKAVEAVASKLPDADEAELAAEALEEEAVGLVGGACSVACPRALGGGARCGSKDGVHVWRYLAVTAEDEGAHSTKLVEPSRHGRTRSMEAGVELPAASSQASSEASTGWPSRG